MRFRRPRYGGRFSLEILGVVVASLLIVVALNIPPPARNVVVGVASSFIFGTSALLLQAFHGRVIDTGIREFFGAEMLEAGPVFAYPDFVLAPDVRKALAGYNDQMLYAKPVQHFSEVVYRADLPRAAASNDMEALVHLSSLFDSRVSSPLNIRTDSMVVRHCDCSFISVGLSSNDCTHLYMKTAEEPLFAVVEDGLGSYFIRLADGTEYQSTGGREVGIIVRYTPEPRDVPSRRWFLVAGAGPTATIGAAWFLTHCWRRLHAEAGHKDFVTVISVPSEIARRVRLEQVLTAS